MQLPQPPHHIRKLPVLIRALPLRRNLHVEAVDDNFFAERALKRGEDRVDPLRSIGGRARGRRGAERAQVGALGVAFAEEGEEGQSEGGRGVGGGKEVWKKMR
jgi:hypothetical protein